MVAGLVHGKRWPFCRPVRTFLLACKGIVVTGGMANACSIGTLTKPRNMGCNDFIARGNGWTGCSLMWVACNWNRRIEKRGETMDARVSTDHMPFQHHVYLQLVVARKPVHVTTRSHSCLQVNTGWLHLERTRFEPSLHSQNPDRPAGTLWSHVKSVVLSRGPSGSQPVVERQPTHAVGVP